MGNVRDVLIVVAAVVIIGCVIILASKAAAQETIRVQLKELGIEVTAVEYTKVSPIQCADLSYFHKYDPNEDGVMENCQGLKYDPCQSHDMHRQLTMFWHLGGNCNAKPKPVLNCGFSPKPQGCP